MYIVVYAKAGICRCMQVYAGRGASSERCHLIMTNMSRHVHRGLTALLVCHVLRVCFNLNMVIIVSCSQKNKGGGREGGREVDSLPPSPMVD